MMDAEDLDSYVNQKIAQAFGRLLEEIRFNPREDAPYYQHVENAIERVEAGLWW